MSKPQRQVGENVVPLYPRDPAPSQADSLAPDRSELYRFAAERGLATLKSQQEELSGIRARAVQVVAFLGAATAFLVATALGGLARDPEIRGSQLYQVSIGTAAITAFLTVLLLISILTGRPGRLRAYETYLGTTARRQWQLRFMFDLRGDMLADWVVDSDRGEARRPAAFYELVTRQCRQMELFNSVNLAAIQFRFRLYILLIVVQLSAWILLALRYG